MGDVFNGRGYVITGAASGMGLVMAHLLKRRGARLSLWDRNAEGLNAAARELSDVHTSVVDVTDANAVRLQMEGVAKAIGEIHGVIHSAGILHTGLFEEVDVETHRKIVEVNLFGTIAIAHTAIPYLKTTRGSLVLFGSSSAFYGSPEYSSYGATKAGILNLAQVLQIELAEARIHVGIVNPLFVNTPMINVEHGQSRLIRSDSPFAHIYTAEQVAQAVLRGIERRQFLIWAGWRPRLIFWLSRYGNFLSGRMMAQTWRE